MPIYSQCSTLAHLQVVLLPVSGVARLVRHNSEYCFSPGRHLHLIDAPFRISDPTSYAHVDNPDIVAVLENRREGFDIKFHITDIRDLEVSPPQGRSRHSQSSAAQQHDPELNEILMRVLRSFLSQRRSNKRSDPDNWSTTPAVGDGRSIITVSDDAQSVASGY